MASRAKRWRTLCQLQSWLDPLMLWLSIAWLAVVVVQLLDPHSNPVLEGIATVLWIVFIIDFETRFALAPGKRTFLKHNFVGRDAEEPDTPIAGADDLKKLREEIAALRMALETREADSPAIERRLKESVVR